MVALISGIICRFSEGFKGGLGRIINFVAFIFLATCILRPLFSYVNKEAGGIIFPDVTPSITQEDDYFERLAALTEENLKKDEEKALEQRFSLNNDDLEIEFFGVVNKSVYQLEKIILHMRSLGALSKRDAILTYLEEKYLCKAEVIEEIDGG